MIPVSAENEWWRDAIFYQIYPRSFQDSNGDGLGDLKGIIERIGYLKSLGINALWLSPFYPSPDVDAGYDVADYCDVDPKFGTLEDFENLVSAAHAVGIKVTIDIVPNHCSNQHPWFVEAVNSGRGSEARELFHFVDGRGENGDLPPSNWQSVFGGPSWTRVSEPDGTAGQWYYHLFAAEQPDFNWRNPKVLAEFKRIMKFWLDRGVDGFRIDVSDALIKDTSWTDTEGRWPIIPKDDASGVHEIYRQLRAVMDEYPGDRMAVVETGADDDIVALFIRPDEMHLAFNFKFVKAQWSADSFAHAITSSLQANRAVGAPVTWVTDNHDTVRSATRYATNLELAGAYVPNFMGLEDVPSIDIDNRNRALALLLFSLPGATYIYNGQELGLPNVNDLPDEVIQDPLFARTQGEFRGRDGCRIPMPWQRGVEQFGFSSSLKTWLPIPERYEDFVAEAQDHDPASLLNFYRAAIQLRTSHETLRKGNVTNIQINNQVLDIEIQGIERLRVLVNFGPHECAAVPDGLVLLASRAVSGQTLPPDTAVVLRLL